MECSRGKVSKHVAQLGGVIRKGREVVISLH